MTDRQNLLFPGRSQRIETPFKDTILHIAPLDRRQFHRGLFDQLGIELPKNLEKAVDNRQAEFLAGRAMAMRALSELGLPSAPLPIGPDRAPIWPEGIQGSISHTQQWCAALVTCRSGYFPGVDIESDLSDNAMQSVGRMVMNDTERDVVERSGMDRSAMMAATFSGKETLFKALYPLVGSFFGFEAARLQAILEDGTLLFSLSRELAKDLPKGQVHKVTLHRFKGHVLTWRVHTQNYSAGTESLTTSSGVLSQ